MADIERQYQSRQVTEALLNNIASNPSAVDDIYKSVIFQEGMTEQPPQWEIGEGRILIHHYLDATKMREAIRDAVKRGEKIDTIAFASDVKQVTADCFSLVDEDCGFSLDEQGNLEGQSDVHITRFVDYSDYLDPDGEKRSFSIVGSRAEGIFSHLHDLRQVCFFGHSVCEQHVGSSSIPLLGDDTKVEQIILGITGGNPYIPPRAFMTQDRGAGAIVNLNRNQITNFGKEAFAYTSDLDGLKQGLELLESKPPLRYKSLDKFLSSLSETEVNYIKAHPHYGLQWVESTRDKARAILRKQIKVLEKSHIPCRRSRSDDASLLDRAAIDKDVSLLDRDRQCIEADVLLNQTKRRVDDQVLAFETYLNDLKENQIPEAEKAFEKAKEEGTSRSEVAKCNDRVKDLYAKVSDMENAITTGKSYSEGIQQRIDANTNLREQIRGERTDLEERRQIDFQHMVKAMEKASDEGRLYLGLDNLELSNMEDRAFLNSSVKTDPILDTNRANKASQFLEDIRGDARTMATLSSIILSGNEGENVPVYLADENVYLQNDSDHQALSAELVSYMETLDPVILDTIVENNAEKLRELGLADCTGPRSLSKFIGKVSRDMEAAKNALESIGENLHSPSRDNITELVKQHFEPSAEGAENRYEIELVSKGVINRDYIRLASRMFTHSPVARKTFEESLSKYLEERNGKNVISRGMNTRTGKQSMFNTSVDAVLDSTADRHAKEVGDLTRRLNAVRQKSDEMSKRFPGWVSTKDYADLTEEGRLLKQEIDRIESAPVGRSTGDEAYAMNDTLTLVSPNSNAGSGAYSYCGTKAKPLGTYDSTRPRGDKGAIDADMFEGKDKKGIFSNSFVNTLKFGTVRAMGWVAEHDIFQSLSIKNVTLTQSFANIAKLTGATLLLTCDLVGQGVYGIMNKKENQRMAEDLAKEMVKDYLSKVETDQTIRIESGKTILLDGKYTHVSQSEADKAMMQLTKRAEDFDVWRTKYEDLLKGGSNEELSKVCSIYQNFANQVEQSPTVRDHGLFYDLDEGMENFFHTDEEIPHQQEENRQSDPQGAEAAKAKEENKYEAEDSHESANEEPPFMGIPSEGYEDGNTAEHNDFSNEVIDFDFDLPSAETSPAEHSVSEPEDKTDEIAQKRFMNENGGMEL